MNKYWFRITKYNPINRNELWHYMIDEWTSITNLSNYNVGWEEYKNTESYYVSFIISLLNNFGYEKLSIFALEKSFILSEFEPIRIKWFWKNWKILFKDIINKRKINLSLDEISLFIKFTLREMLWWILIWENIEIQFWYDYYMYILTSNINIVDYIKNSNYEWLYIEEVDLNYFQKDKDWINTTWYNENHFKYWK